MSDVYSHLPYPVRTQYEADLSSFQARLALVQAQLNTLLTQPPVDSFTLNSGDGGSQAATYRKISELEASEDRLINKIRQIQQKLYGGGMANVSLRRK